MEVVSRTRCQLFALGINPSAISPFGGSVRAALPKMAAQHWGGECDVITSSVLSQAGMRDAQPVFTQPSASRPTCSSVEFRTDTTGVSWHGTRNEQLILRRRP